MNAGTVALVRRSFPDRPALGVAVSRAILMRVATGELPPTVRLHRPADMLAFSRQDRASAGFPKAVTAARERGYAPVLRLAGGRAAVYHEGTLACATLAQRTERPRDSRSSRSCSFGRSGGSAWTLGWERCRGSTARAPGASTLEAGPSWPGSASASSREPLTGGR